MRVQHNIMAMSAYRNYTNNVSAMKKNLERLSSGYKINRAGDDAAGLAISEKMRAQITGLETAQKNAKDGISLVQTAEGALTEVHDMLNRMVELATQSANGTYDDSTDRYQLQKEMNQLRDEINRIADSSNFNGIQLLDGSMSSTGGVATAGAVGQFDLPGVGTQNGVDTVLHKGSSTAANVSPGFSVNLHNLEFANEEGQELTINIGDNYSIKITGTGGSAMSASDIATLIQGATSGTTTVEFTGITVGATAGEWDFGGVTFTVTATDNVLTFVQGNDDDVFDAEMTVSISGLPGEAITQASYTTGKYTPGALGGSDSWGSYNPEASAAITITLDIDGTAVTLTLQNITATLTAGGLASALLTATDTGATITLSDYFTAKANDDGTLTFTLNEDGEEANVKITGFTAALAAAFGPGGSGHADTVNPSISAGTWTAKRDATSSNGIKGAPNVQTTVIKKNADDSDAELASTVIKISKDMIANGAKITIGGEEYTFTTSDTDKDCVDSTVNGSANKKIYIGDLDLDSDVGFKTALDRLTVVADGNSVWSVGYADDEGKITLREKVTAGKSYMDIGKPKFDLKTLDGIKASLGYQLAGLDAKSGTSLILQIGDTAESYNQLTVDISDCHTGALGIDTISIADQKSAQSAVDAIKNAINYVSDVRGTLGATQNRLDHTINNLSVMTENIQDAESTIRDTDIAEEMMAYTKNNILIQSAQAMLAQANQVPQGVLQLLQ